MFDSACGEEREFDGLVVFTIVFVGKDIDRDVDTGRDLAVDRDVHCTGKDIVVDRDAVVDRGVDTGKDMAVDRGVGRAELSTKNKDSSIKNTSQGI